MSSSYCPSFTTSPQMSELGTYYSMVVCTRVLTSFSSFTLREGGKTSKLTYLNVYDLLTGVSSWNGYRHQGPRNSIIDRLVSTHHLPSHSYISLYNALRTVLPITSMHPPTRRKSSTLRFASISNHVVLLCLLSFSPLCKTCFPSQCTKYMHCASSITLNDMIHAPTRPI